MKRLFIGVPISSNFVFQAVRTWKRDERLNNNVLKWANPENWHVTLVFLGNTSVTAIPQLQKLIEQSFIGIQAFKTNLKGGGVFPNSNNPKVLWLGIESLGPLMPAQTNLVELLKLHGFSLDNKPLKPHLTLARIRNAVYQTSINSLIDQYQNFNFGTVDINRVILYESLSTPDGPVYKPLFVKELT